MSLQAGTRLGPYLIDSPLGAGGMGEVYRARDTRLNRDVAVKVLPPEVARDEGRRRRFEQEARAVAALNHPNIVAVYDIGSQGDVLYMVCELVEGESLREVIRRGPVAVRKLLDVAAQVSDGLAAAHTADITHRDLKPENILINREGRAKILDFGLAKQAALVAPADQKTKTLTCTEPGAILGTVNYMSPEQAAGRPLDLRSDQFSFGLILYEMSAGKRAFERETTVQTLSAILTDEPPPTDSRLPAPLRWAIDRCLAKEPAQRYDSTRDLHRDLRHLRDHLSEALTTETAAGAVPVATRRRISRRVVVTVAAAVAVGIALGALLTPRQGPDLKAYRYTPLVTNHRWQRHPAWSPDGKSLAYAAESDGAAQIFTRGLDSATPVQVTSLKGQAYFPFWSNDSRRVFFILIGPPSGLWSVAAAGGAPELFLPNVLRAALTPDNRTLVILRTEDRVSSVWLSSPPGSAPVRYEPAPFDAAGFYDLPWMQCSPDGRQVLLGINRTANEHEFWLLPLPPGTPRRVLRSLPNLREATFTWMPDSRHIVMALKAQPDAPQRLSMADVYGDAWWPITTGITDEGARAISSDGRRIIYTAHFQDFDLVEAPVAGGPSRELLTTSRWEGMPAWAPVNQQFVFVTTRRGPEEIWIKSRQEGWERPLVTAQDFPHDSTRNFLGPVFSPDGQRIAYTRVSAAGTFLWISPLAGGAPTRVTSDPPVEFPPTWSPDGAWLAFTRSEGAKSKLVKVRLGSVGAPVVLTELPGSYVPQWSPTGEWITCPLADGFGVISPDGKNSRVLYKGRDPLVFWSKDGRTLYGVTRNGAQVVLKAVDVAGGAERIVGDLGQDFPASWAGPSIRLSLAPDGRTFVYAVSRYRSDLWLLEGFEPPPGPLGRLLRTLRLRN